MSWLAEARRRDIAVNRPLFQEEAQQIIFELGVTNFEASKDLLDNLK